MKKANFKIDFIGVGAPKSGTSWLYYCLKEHPQIFLPDKKEIDFFNKKKPYYARNNIWNYLNGCDWYENFFKDCPTNKIKGEFSVNYLSDPGTPELISRHFPEAKIIMILRNPIDRLYSHYSYAKAKNKTNQTFEKFINTKKKIVEIGFYFTHITNYLKYFNKDRILILLYNDLKKSPKEFIARVYSFLGVDDKFIPDNLNKKINTTSSKIYSHQVLPQLYRKLNNLKLYNLALKILKILPLNNLIKFIYFKSQKGHPKIKASTRKKIFNLYYPQNQNLSELLNKNLDLWK